MARFATHLFAISMIFAGVPGVSQDLSVQVPSGQCTASAVVDTKERVDPCLVLPRELVDLERETHRAYYLPSMMSAAWRLCEYDKVGAYAREALNESFSKYARPENPLVARYWAHEFLGLLALRNSDERAAVSHLIESTASLSAGAVNGIPAPSMLLSSFLLMRGYVPEVVAHIDALSPWIAGSAKIEEWKRAIENHQDPDFSALAGC